MGKVGVLCEFSGVVRDAFIRRGHYAVSCDLLPTQAPGPHIQGDCLDQDWRDFDLIIAHPPCTYICAGSMNWINRQEGRRANMESGIEFVRKIMALPVPRMAVENPIGVLSTRIRKPDQIFHAYDFGHPFKKDVCLWLKGIPPLVPTVRATGKIRTFDFWSKARKTRVGGCRKSVTFLGVAVAMADQWGSLLGGDLSTPPT